MAFDFNQLKQRFSKQGATQDPAATQQVQTATTASKPAKTSPKVEALKRGFLDIKAVCEEGKIKLFAKQVVVVLLAFFGVRYLVGKINAQKEVVMDRISAIAIQQTHQDDYVANKDRLLRLEPLFPDISKKNEWLIQSLMKTFSAHQIQADINGNANEKAEGSYTVMSQEVSFKESFANVGKFVADVENGDDFLRLSNITISKVMDTASLGQNTVTMRFATLFPKEKYAKRLFKDYEQQMKKINAQAAPAANTSAPAPSEPAAQGGTNAL